VFRAVWTDTGMNQSGKMME